MQVMNQVLMNYKQDQLNILKLRFPDRSEEELSVFLDRKIEENVKSPSCRFYNNYTGKTVKLDLLRFTDWYFDKNPISTEHGVYFKRHEQAVNLPAKLLEHILNSRKVNKKLMLKAKEEGNTELSKYYNTRQKVDKIFANSWYGVAGQSSSAFYNLFVALSITGKGQSIISTAMTTFERFLANNILFRNLDECLLFISSIVQETESRETEGTLTKDKKILDGDMDVSTVTNYLVNQFMNKGEGRKQKNIIQNALGNIDQTSLNRVYYKNNLFAFFLNKKPMKLFEKILTGVDQFRNPERVPEAISDDLTSLWNIVEEFVFYNYGTFDRIKILKTIKRKAVITVDTDSNFLNLEPFYKFVQKQASFEIKDDDDQMTFKIISVMAFFLGNVIASAFAKYTEQCNVPEPQRPIIAMKNEFLMKRVLLTSRKKNYASVVLLQEGVEVPEEDQLDIKGLTIKKSNVNRNVGKYLQDILELDILAAPQINTVEVLQKLEALENQIRDSFLRGETTYMTPMKANGIESYKTPFQMAQIRGALAWNAVYPTNSINFPAQMNVVKLTADSIDKLAPIYESHKEVYQALKAEVFDNKDLGKYGLTIWAMPKNAEKIPDWVIPFIDVETIIRDNLSNFLPILNSIGIKTINVRADELFFSNIVDF